MRKIAQQLRRIPLALLGIILISLVFRLVWLDRVPAGISDDELGFVLNAKAVFLTGSDIKGGWSPLSLTPVTGEFPQAELPYVLIAPIIGLLPFSLFAAKLPYVLISTLIVVLLYLLTAKLIGSKEAVIVGLVASLNPGASFLAEPRMKRRWRSVSICLRSSCSSISKAGKSCLRSFPCFSAFTPTWAQN